MAEAIKGRNAHTAADTLTAAATVEGALALIEGEKLCGRALFFASGGRMCYEIYLDGVISYEPPAKELFAFPLGTARTVRIRGLLFGKDGRLQNSRVLGEFECDALSCGGYIYCTENTAQLISEEKLLRLLQGSSVGKI